jgi:hypothetical protein
MTKHEQKRVVEVEFPTGEMTDETMRDYTRRSDVAYALNDLHDKALWLARNMTDLAERIERDGLATGLNSCGEIGSLGPDINRACAEISLMQRFYGLRK